jgi:hypothetical protein
MTKRIDAIRLGAVVLFLCGASACGGSSSPAPGAGGCTVTVGGAVTTTFATCSATAATNSTQPGIVAVAITASGGPGSTAGDTLQAAFNISGSSFSTGTYSASNVTQGAVTLIQSGTTVWIASQNASTANQGAFTLNITGTGTTVSASTVTDWPEAVGGLSATLEPQGSATGTVTVQIAFNGGSAPAIPSP